MKFNNIFIIKSDNPKSLNAKLNISHWKYILNDQHISFYSKDALKKLCEKFNIKLVKYCTFKHAYGGINCMGY